LTISKEREKRKKQKRYIYHKLLEWETKKKKKGGATGYLEGRKGEGEMSIPPAFYQKIPKTRGGKDCPTRGGMRVSHGRQKSIFYEGGGRKSFLLTGRFFV